MVNSTAFSRIIPLAFTVALLVLGGMVLLIHDRSEHAVQEILGRELTTQSVAATGALEQARAQGATVDAMAIMLRRLRDTGHLGSVQVVGKAGLILIAGDGETPSGTPVAATSATPELVARVLAGETRVDEEVVLLDEPFRRIYLPIHVDGQIWGVLVSEAHDSAADGLAALHWPLWSGLVAAIIAATALAGALFVAVRTTAIAQTALARQQQFIVAGTLAASIAHEVRNPLQMILAAIQMLERQSDPIERAELAATIAEEVRRADDQLDAFLDLARDTPLRHDRTDLGALMTRTVNLLHGRAAQAQVQILVDQPASPVIAMVDARRIGQALINLGLNAVQALESAHRPGTIYVALTCDPLRREACFVVTDDGPGIPAPLREAALDPFVSTRPDGTGLGLPQAKRAAERHGGRLELAASPQGGTRVTLILPLGSDGACAS